MDRAVIGLVLKPIGDEFHLSGQQLGLLAGLAYGLPFAIAAIGPTARYCSAAL
jgi:hypothetical protein